MDDKKNQLTIELTDDVAQGLFSNLAIITHSSTEFVLDFVQILPGMPKAKVRSRILMSPIHAKRLLLALDNNLKRFEQANGVIVDTNAGQVPPINFDGGGPPTQA
ncbi:MAG: DUF3467 domain-containing protein [Chitinophagales bacterium]|nr:DUF3467 domain-containing protein [Bacteroidota bacterium]